MFGCRPTIGGKYCLGERKRFRSCNIDVSIAVLQQAVKPRIVLGHYIGLMGLHVFVYVHVWITVFVAGVPCRLQGFPDYSVL